MDLFLNILNKLLVLFAIVVAVGAILGFFTTNEFIETCKELRMHGTCAALLAIIITQRRFGSKGISK